MMLVRDLRTHPAVTCFDELYSAGNDESLSYRRYRGRLVWRPTGKHLDTVFDQPHEVAGFKLMYNHLRWPGLKRALKARNVRLIHLVRENGLKQFVSYLAAVKRGRFGSTRPLEVTMVECPVDGLLDRLSERERMIERHRQWVAKFHSVEVLYEHYSGDRISEQRQMLDFLGVDPNVRIGGDLVKLNPDRLEDFVTNYSEVQRVLAGTPFARFLDE